MILHKNISSIYPAILLLFFCSSCTGINENIGYSKVIDIPVPAGFRRAPVQSGSFMHWLRQLRLKKNNQIRLYNREIIASHSFNILAVIDKPLYFQDNTEECIDFVLRLWADYHFENNKLSELYLYNHPGDKIHFLDKINKPFNNADPRVNASYRKFLYSSMTAINPYSVASGGMKLERDELRAGDCIIQTAGNTKGHASLILDECSNSAGEKHYLIGFGYTPAQEFHIEKAPAEYGNAGWFSLERYIRYLKTYYPEWGEPVLIRL